MRYFINYKILKNNMLVQDRNYNRDNITDTVRINSEETIEQTKEKTKKFRKEFYGYAYGCNPDYKKILLQQYYYKPYY